MDFASVEQEFVDLKARFESGSLTEADVKAQLEDLMIADEQGRWWIIGFETGEWYVHDGEKWVQQEPPGAAPVSRQARPSAADLPLDSKRTLFGGSRPLVRLTLSREAVPALLIVAGWLVCLILWIISEISTYYLPWASIALLGSTGGLVTGLVLRRTDPPSPWRQVPLVSLCWAVGMAIIWSLWAPYSAPRWTLNALVVGLVGALITATAFIWTSPTIRWKYVALVTLGWAIGCVIGGAIGWAVFWLSEQDASYSALVYALWIGVSGAVGSWLAFWQLRDAVDSSP